MIRVGSGVVNKDERERLGIRVNRFLLYGMKQHQTEAGQISS
jgi:hypothetical protein